MAVGDVQWSSGVRGVVVAEELSPLYDGTPRQRVYVQWQLPGTQPLLPNPDALPPAGGA